MTPLPSPPPAPHSDSFRGMVFWGQTHREMCSTGDCVQSKNENKKGFKDVAQFELKKI
jgi:hypothetical protein